MPQPNRAKINVAALTNTNTNNNNNNNNNNGEEEAVLTAATATAAAATTERVRDVLEQQLHQSHAATAAADTERETLEARMRATAAALQQRSATAYQTVSEALASPLPVPPEAAAAAVTAATGATYYKYDEKAAGLAGGDGRTPSFNPDNYPVRLYSSHDSRGERRPWHYGLCTLCRHTDSCLEAWCCSTCQVARQYNMLQHLSPTPHGPLLAVLLAGRLLCGWSWPETAALFVVRKELRGRYGIEGSACGDVLTVVCCPVCAVQQQLLEMSSLAAFPGAFCYHEGPVMERQML